MRTMLALALLGVGAFGQSGRPAPVQPPSLPSDISLPRIAPIPPLGSTFPVSQPLAPGFRGHGFRPHSYYPFGYPYYGSGAYVNYQPEPVPPNVIVVQPPPPQSPPTPAEPIKSAIRDYHWTTGESEPAGAEPASFVIVRKDGSTEDATLLWMHGGVLHFVTPRGEDRTAPLDSIDRDRTEKMNRSKGLRFLIPTPSSPAR